jgi:hypothetical protein|eukprot:COSAG01_NODE_4513_length_4963_cov_2.746094_2_plen_64_part_00
MLRRAYGFLVQDKVCVQTISACKGVTVNPPRIERPKVNNGGPQVRPRARTGAGEDNRIDHHKS